MVASVFVTKSLQLHLIQFSHSVEIYYFSSKKWPENCKKKVEHAFQVVVGPVELVALY